MRENVGVFQLKKDTVFELETLDLPHVEQYYKLTTLSDVLTFTIQ